MPIGPPRCSDCTPIAPLAPPRRALYHRASPAFAGLSARSGRQDLNLRPPGPQPGALPDCATPRGCRKRATGIEPALEAWKASVQPQHFARRSDFRIIARDGERVRSVHRAPGVAGAGENRPVSGNHRFMQIPGVHIETLHNPTRYSYAQIEKACTLAALLNRGKLVLVEPPRSR
jgi:hypothetical protein